MERVEQAIDHLYVQQGIKHQHFVAHTYQAKSWHKAQRCYSKVESTGKGLNVPHIVSNLPEEDARQIYFGCYMSYSYYLHRETS